MTPFRPHSYPGLLVAFEGIDGCGKGTQLQLTADAIIHEGWGGFLGDRVVISKTPGGTKFGDFTRDVLFKTVTTHELEPETASLMCFASHLETWAKIVKPALEKGQIVLTDRWDAFSGTTYGIHGGIRPIHPAIVQMRQDFSGPAPDLTFLFKGDPEIFLARARARREETHQDGKVWNTMEKQRTVQIAYEQMFKQPPWHAANPVVIQSDQGSPEEIFKSVWDHVFRAVRHKFDLT